MKPEEQKSKIHELKNWHELKTWPNYFQEVFMGYKNFEIRFDDRGFQKGDYLILKEWDNIIPGYTGRELTREIKYILKGGQFGLLEGYVAMSIS